MITCNETVRRLTTVLIELKKENKESAEKIRRAIMIAGESGNFKLRVDKLEELDFLEIESIYLKEVSDFVSEELIKIIEFYKKL